MRNWSFSLLSAHLIRHHGYTLTQIMKAVVKIIEAFNLEGLRVNCALADHTLAIKQLYSFFLLYHTVQQYIKTPGSHSNRMSTPLGLQVEARTSNHYQCKKRVNS